MNGSYVNIEGTADSCDTCQNAGTPTCHTCMHSDVLEACLSSEERIPLRKGFRYVWGACDVDAPMRLVAGLEAIVARLVGEEILADGEGMSDTSANLSLVIDAIDDLIDAINYKAQEEGR